MARPPAQRAAPVQVELADDGCGMSPAVAERAFEPFFTTRASEGGIGLGLSTCRDLVTELDGSIQLSSQEGVGTNVTVRIPLERC